MLAPPLGLLVGRSVGRLVIWSVGLLKYPIRARSYTSTLLSEPLFFSTGAKYYKQRWKRQASSTTTTTVPPPASAAGSTTTTVPPPASGSTTTTATTTTTESPEHADRSNFAPNEDGSRIYHFMPRKLGKGTLILSNNGQMVLGAKLPVERKMLSLDPIRKMFIPSIRYALMSFALRNVSLLD